MNRLLARLLLAAAAACLVPACGGGSDPAPVPFTLLNPAPSATGVTINPTYSWTTHPAASSFLLQVSVDPAFGVVLIHRPGLLTLSDTPPTTLAAGTNYYWRVYANTPTGTVLADGSPGLFTTLPAPGAFSLQTPTNGAIDQPTSPLFTWTSSTNAASYTVQAATDAGFASIVIDQPGIVTTSFVPVSPLSTSTTYFWRVTAVNTSGSLLATERRARSRPCPRPPAVSA